MAILTAILVFSVIIIFHELGHFLVARAVGVTVEEFSVGFGPKLASLGKRTKFSLRLIPMGGYVRMLGESEETDTNDPGSFQNKTPWQRMAIILAGPIMNFLLALVIFVVIYGAVGVVVDDIAIIGEVLSGSPAEAAGLVSGDEIISIGSRSTIKWTDVQESVRESVSETLTFTVKRNGKVQTFAVTPRQGEQYPEVGISPRTKRLSVAGSLSEGVKETWRMTGAVFSSLIGIVTRKIPVGDLTGPIGIVHFVGEAAKAGIFSVLSLAALISVNLGLFNLLPIPALDGSKVIILGIEAVRKKRMAPEKEGIIHLVGFVLLITLMLFIMYKDIVRLIS